MNTPIVDFVKKYAHSNTVRLHMPGHKGQNVLGCEMYDITEIKGADSLFEADGIIAESENNASRLFGTKKTLYSTEGSTLCIKTMLALVRKNGVSNRILASRNSHKALIYGCAQLDIDIDWLFDENDTFSLCRCEISPEILEKRLSAYEELPCAVYVTSPDYLGNMLDIKALADVAHKFGVPLLVDNAHGAYLHFLGEKLHPMDLGADMCCDSAHKTLPVLTGGAYLHINNVKYCEKAKSMMAVFASTSPSYLILQSLDYANKLLSEDYPELLNLCVAKLNQLKSSVTSAIKTDPLKLTVKGSYAEKMRKYGIECEYQDPDFTVMMFTPCNPESDFDAVKRFFAQNTVKHLPNELKMPVPQKKMSVRQAIFADYECIDVYNAVGRICASPAVGCPPAVPVVVSGEVISSQAVEIFRYYGIKKCAVLIENSQFIHN
ncbi:MAG: PLP-dependent transferase [Clostridia bacterium]|nr:PLP-dependent transferase [Clostridia bacterium]